MMRRQPLLPERLDDPALSLEETDRALTDLEKVNRWLFGIGASRRALLPRLSRRKDLYKMIDLGTGSGQVSAEIAERAGLDGMRLRVIGVDRKLSHLLAGRRQGYSQLRVVACAKALPFRDDAVDWSFSNLLLHHFSPEQNRQILAEMSRVAKAGTAVVDLRRSLLASALFRLALPLLRLERVASYDGRLSIDQAWSLDEVMQLTDGLSVIELRRRFPFRFSLLLGPS